MVGRIVNKKLERMWEAVVNEQTVLMCLKLKVLGSNFGLDNGYPNRLFVVFLIPYRQMSR
jgi:hypothetical protein